MGYHYRSRALGRGNGSELGLPLRQRYCYSHGNDSCRLFFQLKSGEIQEFTTTVEDTKTYGNYEWAPGEIIQAEVMPGTRLAFFDLNTTFTSNPKMHDFFQDVDGNVVEYVKDRNDIDRWKPTGFQLDYEETTYRTPIAATRYKSKGKLRTCFLTHNPMNQLQYQQTMREGLWESTPTVVGTLCNVPCGTLTVHSHSYDSIETEICAYMLAPLHVIKEAMYKVDKNGEKWEDREYKDSYIDLGGDTRHIATKFYI